MAGRPVVWRRGGTEACLHATCARTAGDSLKRLSLEANRIQRFLGFVGSFR